MKIDIPEGGQYASLNFMILDSNGKAHSVNIIKLEGKGYHTFKVEGDAEMLARRLDALVVFFQSSLTAVKS